MASLVEYGKIYYKFARQKKKCNKHLTFSLSTKIVFLLSINSSLREN